MAKQLPQVFGDWFEGRGWAPHRHQKAMLKAGLKGEDCLLIAPTGGGKTLAGFLPSLVDLYNSPTKGLHTLYISPLKALAADIRRNLTAPVTEMGLPIRIEDRTGDTSQSQRRRQRHLLFGLSCQCWPTGGLFCSERTPNRESRRYP